MKVVRLHAARDLRIHQEGVPTPGHGESLLRVTSVGLCGSDLHWFGEGGIGDVRLERPLVLGHEFAAVVEDGGLKGQRVAVDPLVACHHCESCLEGNANFCTAQRFAGTTTEDGALREFLVWPSDCLVPLPDDLSDEDGAMLEPLGIAIHAVRLARLRPGSTVGVYGCGPIGLLIAQVARLSGAVRVIATEKLGHRLHAAECFGAEVFAAADADTPARIIDAVQGRGLDAVFEAAGDNAAVELAIATAKRGGVVVLAGIPVTDIVSFPASTSRRKGLTIKVVHRMNNTYARAVQLAQSRRVDLRALESHIFPLDRAAEAFNLAERRDGLKILIDPR